MKASKKVSTGVLDARFLRAIEVWCAGRRMSAGAFGATVYRDRGFVASLRDGRCPRLRTVDRALAVMGEPPAGAAFRREVEAFLAVTGVKRSLLGQEATGNPSFVAQLLDGVSPTLATVEAVRASMKPHASAAEWREIRARAGAMPAILTDGPLPSPEPPVPPGTDRPDRSACGGGDEEFMDTSEAAATADAMERSGGPEGRERGAGRDAGGAGQRERQADLFDPQPQSPADAAVAWAVDHLSERQAVFVRSDLLAAALAHDPGSVTISDAEAAVARLEKEGTLHACGLPLRGESLTTDLTVANEKETIALMERGQGVSRPVMRSWIAGPLLHNGRLTVGQKEAVKTILSSRDRVVGVQGYAGTGKTTMLDRARQLAAKSGYRTIGVAPSASTARTLAAEAGIETETLQRFLARNAGIAEGRLTRKGAKEMRAAFRKTVLVVDEGSLASTVQARDLLRIANAIRIPRVVLVGDEKQLDAVDAGKPFAQLQAAGMKTAVMDEILRQKDVEMKEAVRASLAGEIGKAFGKLGDRIAEVNPDNLAGAAAARWLKLSPHERENTGLMAPSHALRREINGHIRERLARDGVIRGSAYEGERLVSHGHTSAEKMVAANYARGDIVAFHRDYKSLGVAKGDELRVAGVNRRKGMVMLEGKDGDTVPWRPRAIGAKRGAVEVYRTEAMELRAGDRIRWTRNDTGLGLINSDTAEVTSVRGGFVAFRLTDGRTLELGRDDPQLRHLEYGWASTVHAFQGRTVDNAIAVMEARHAHLTTQKSFYVEISRARHNAELVTDDAKALRETLEAATGERVSALEGVGVAAGKARGGEKERGRGLEAQPERPAGSHGGTAERGREADPGKAPEPDRAAELNKSRGSRGIEMEM